MKTALNGTPRKITNSGKTGILIEVASKEQGARALKIDNVCGVKCITKEHGFFNESRRMVYVYTSEIEDMESFKEGLKKQYSVTSVTEAHWVKPRGQGATVYVLTFQRENIPAFIKIVGEYSLTKVYEYKTKPLQCAKC